MTPPIILSRSEATQGRVAVVVSVRPGHRIIVVARPDQPDDLILLVASYVAAGTRLAARHERGT